MFPLFETISLQKLASVPSDTVRCVSICSCPIAFKDMYEECSEIDRNEYFQLFKNVNVELV